MIIKIKGFFFGIRVENMSKCNSRLRKPLKKSLNQIERGKWAGHFHSANWHNSDVRPRNVQIGPKHIRFDFLGIKIWPNSYLNRPSLFSKHKTSINMELKLEIRTPLSPYVKEILETFFLGISFLLSDLILDLKEIHSLWSLN